jgi:hypothetical protein
MKRMIVSVILMIILLGPGLTAQDTDMTLPRQTASGDSPCWISLKTVSTMWPTRSFRRWYSSMWWMSSKYRR